MTSSVSLISRAVFPWTAALAALALLAAPCAAEKRIRRAGIVAPAPLPEGSVLVAGFLGAWERWDNPKRSVRKLALRLREGAGPDVFVETAGNHSRATIRKFIHEALDRNRDGKLDEAEARSVGIILYGQSFGGAAAVRLARELKKWNVPVCLTVQVDSIGRGDHLIPSNVKRAVNFYQRDPGPVRGQPRIRAEDASKTEILANIRHFYVLRDVDMSGYPRAARGIMTLSHWKMDNDPMVWAEVEGFIRAEIVRWQAERITGGIR
ncbi:MAG: hypothetical protein C0504_16995 [Candidatus Solibacter sp.]|nr:hypothetical protein [Candidatus Solibacter sp.]